MNRYATRLCEECRRSFVFRRRIDLRLCALCPVRELTVPTSDLIIWDQPRLTRERVSRIRRSFCYLQPDIELFAQVLYARLFAEYPHIKRLFRGDQMAQEKQLAAMLTTMIRGLDRLDQLKPTLWSLGRRHVKYGVREADFDAFFEALMWALGVFLGDRFSRSTQDAWVSFYAFISQIMQDRLDWHSPAGLQTFDAA